MKKNLINVGNKKIAAIYINWKFKMKKGIYKKENKKVFIKAILTEKAIFNSIVLFLNVLCLIFLFEDSK